MFHPKQGNNFRCFQLWLGDMVRRGTLSGVFGQAKRRLLAGFIGLKLFARCQPCLTRIRLQMDNTTAVHYVNKIGGTISFDLCMLALGMWKWAEARNIDPSAVYLPGQLNLIADTLSRLIDLDSEWMLNPSIFRRLFNLQYSESRPVCYPSEQPSPKFCVLVPRSRSNGEKCIHSSLVRSSELCLSPIQPDYEVSEKDPNRQGQSPFYGSMVPGPSFNAVRLLTIASECFGSVDTTILPREATAETSDSGRVAAVRRCLSKFSLPSRVSEIVMSSWRSSTQAQYGSAWAKWSSWCVQRQEDPVTYIIFLEFLAELFDAGLQYRTINVYRSAISVSHLPVDGCLLGNRPLVTRFMKGVHELCPLQPRVFNTWSVNTVLLFLRSLHPAEDLPLKTLTYKFVMLSALVSAARSSYLHQCDLKFHYVKNSCYYFIIPGLVKRSRPNKPHIEVCLPSFPEDPRLCIFTYCKEYIRRSQAVRPRPSLFVLHKVSQTSQDLLHCPMGKKSLFTFRN